jgi:hypothetical protein
MKREVRKRSVTLRGKDFWGPPLWSCTHLLSLSVTFQNGKYYIIFLWLLTYLLPCDYCRKNLREKLSSHPGEAYMKDSESAFYYSYIIHDLANQHITLHHPSTPKSSPPFDQIYSAYVSQMTQYEERFWGPRIWAMIHILAVTLRPENADKYQLLLQILVFLLPDSSSRETLNRFLQEHPIEPYLRSNHDAFFYSYILHKDIDTQLNKTDIPPYDKVKSFYFSALGEECKECQI